MRHNQGVKNLFLIFCNGVVNFSSLHQMLGICLIERKRLFAVFDFTQVHNTIGPIEHQVDLGPIPRSDCASMSPGKNIRSIWNFERLFNLFDVLKADRFKSIPRPSMPTGFLRQNLPMGIVHVLGDSTSSAACNPIEVKLKCTHLCICNRFPFLFSTAQWVR